MLVVTFPEIGTGAARNSASVKGPDTGTVPEIVAVTFSKEVSVAESRATVPETVTFSSAVRVVASNAT
jgi:hypothetical protein